MGIKRTGDTGKGTNQSGVKAAFRDREQYAGDFRIIGTVWKDAKKMLGYALMAIPSMKIALRPEEMLKELLRSAKFENAILSPEGKVVNTECSMDRLFKFNPQMQVVANKGMQILAEIHVNGAHMGYRVLSDQGKTMDLTESTLLELVTADPSILINAKIVPSQSGGNIISAIKKPFKVIERERIGSETSEVISSNKTAIGFQSRYIHNATRNFFSSYLQRGRFAPQYIMGEAFRKKLGRFLREVVAVEFPATEQVVKPLYKVIEESVNHLATERPAQEDTRSAVEKAVGVVDVFIALCMLAKVSSVKTKFGTSDVSSFTSMDFDRKKHWSGKGYIKDWNIIRNHQALPLPDKKLVMLMHEASKSSENNAFSLLTKDAIATQYKALHDLGTTEIHGYRAKDINPVYFENQSPQLVAILSRYHVTGGRDREALARRKFRFENAFRTSDLDFTTDVGLENLGLTLDKSRVGIEVPSTVYGKIHLKYYLDGITDTLDLPEELVEQYVNCYGDLRILYHMGKAETGRYVRKDDPSHIIRFAVLAICNPKLADLVAPRLSKNFTNPVNVTLAEAYGVGSLSENSLLFYYSGGFFNRDIKIPLFSRWGSLKVNGNKAISLLDMPEDLKSLVKQVVGVELVPTHHFKAESLYHISC